MRLEAIRKKKGLTQEALASAVGVSRPFISQMESGEYNPSIKTAQALTPEPEPTVIEEPEPETEPES